VISEDPGSKKVRSGQEIGLGPALVEFVPNVLLKVYSVDVEDRRSRSIHK